MPGSFKRVFNYKCFNPRTHKKYDQPISGTDRLMYALIPVPMKGTIFLFTSLPCFLLALIPVPMKGTIMIFLQMKSYPLIALIPVPTEGTMAKLYKINNNSTVLFR